MPNITAKLIGSPVPMDKIVLPLGLDGSSGSNRASETTVKQIDADNDLDAIALWLREFEDSPHTVRAYRREVERLLLWSVLERGKPVSGLTREDLLTYESFLSDPQPADRWCGPKAPRYSEHWKPFKGPLGSNSQRQAQVIVHALFTYLVAAGYLSGNPLALSRRRRRQAKQNESHAVERFLEQELWKEVRDYVESLPKNTDREKDQYERMVFLLTLFYLAGPRVNEVVSHKMGDFFERRGKWWWKITGKGGKTSTIPVSAELITAMARYRTHLGLEAAPKADEDVPLVMSLKGTSRISANMVYRIIKNVFRSTAERLDTKEPHKAEKLRRASTHWLRHTAITHQADAGIELRYLNKSARHSKLETTAIYLHAEEDRWHEAMEAHHLENEPEID